MLKFGNKEFRNLEEQVLENQDNIRFIMEQANLSDLGIKIIQAEPLPDSNALPQDYAGNYGDAYLVGTEMPYHLWIWTRTGDPDEIGRWFDFGELNAPSVVPGPEGPQGEKGDTGERGSIWTTGTGTPTSTQALPNDLYLNVATGDVWRYNGTSWARVTNIQGPIGPQGIQGLTGPQGPIGPQGEQGPRGDVGGFIKIVGIVSDSNQLPPPESLNDLTQAYLVGTAEPYTLYIQVGATSDVALWTDMGPMNVATLVQSGGSYVNIWDADTKLDKMDPPDNTSAYIYGMTPQGAQYLFRAASIPGASYVAVRTPSGDISVPETPANDISATSKKYVDNISSTLGTALQGKLSTNAGSINTLVVNSKLTVVGNNSTPTLELPALPVSTSPVYVLTTESGAGQVKAYSISKLKQPLYKHNIQIQASAPGYSTINIFFEMDSFISSGFNNGSPVFAYLYVGNQPRWKTCLGGTWTDIAGINKSTWTSAGDAHLFVDAFKMTDANNMYLKCKRGTANDYVFIQISDFSVYDTVQQIQ